MKKIFGLAFFSLIAIVSFAQDNTQPSNRIPRSDKKAEKRQRINALLKLEEEQDPVFRKQNAFGIKLATDGYGLSFEKGKFKSPKRTLLYQFELNEKKHNKEEKVSIPGAGYLGQNSLIIGKLNNFYQFKIGLGQQYLIGGKANKSGVAVSAIYAGGLSAGLVKPYLLDFQQAGGGDIIRAKITDSVATGYDIIGASGFTHGWNQLKVKPGLHAKVAMRFDYGRFNETVSAIEAGVNAEYYFSDIEQMVYSNPKKFFFNAYVTILFGRRK